VTDDEPSWQAIAEMQAKSAKAHRLLADAARARVKELEEALRQTAGMFTESEAAEIAMRYQLQCAREAPDLPAVIETVRAKRAALRGAP
jgi:hypothetical protein